MPENTPLPARVPPEDPLVPPLPGHDSSPAATRRAATRAVLTAIVLALGWALGVAATTKHNLVAMAATATLTTRALTSTRARGPWFPALGFALAFAAAYVGDLLATALLLWQHGISAGLIIDHFGALAAAVNDTHTTADWACFATTATATAAATYLRQKLRPPAAGTRLQPPPQH